VNARVPSKLERYSIHEASHAVITLHFGIAIRDVAVARSGGLIRFSADLDDPETEVFIRLAGEVGECLAFGFLDDEASSREDRAFAYQAAFQVTRDVDSAIRLEHDSRAFVRQLLADRWMDVEHVAIALLERGHLSGAEVAVLVAGRPWVSLSHSGAPGRPRVPSLSGGER